MKTAVRKASRKAARKTMCENFKAARSAQANDSFCHLPGHYMIQWPLRLGALWGGFGQVMAGRGRDGRLGQGAADWGSLWLGDQNTVFQRKGRSTKGIPAASFL